MNKIANSIDTPPNSDLCEEQERRADQDRRSRPMNSVLCSMYKGRRRGMQRSEDQNTAFYMDVYDRNLFPIIILIIGLCVADAYFTLTILSKGGTELNPIMERLLEISPNAFFIGKYLMTSIGLCFAVLHINFPFFRIFSMRSVLNFLCGMYIVLIVYELTLLYA